MVRKIALTRLLEGLTKVVYLVFCRKKIPIYGVFVVEWGSGGVENSAVSAMWIRLLRLIAPFAPDWPWARAGYQSDDQKQKFFNLNDR